MSINFAELVMLARTESLKRAEGDMNSMKATGARLEQGVTGSMKKVDKSFSVVGMGAAKMAAAATAAFGAVAAAASLGKAISMQLEFGSALAETSTLLNGNAAEMAKVEKASKSLAATYGGSATAQAQGFYQAISAGAGSAAQATELLDTANRLAIGGVTQVTTAVDILTTATNVYASEGLLAADASDALFVAMKAGKTTITELSTSLGKVLPLSQNLGVSFDETAGTVAALTKSGIATTEAVTGLRAAMTAVLGPSKEATDLAAQLGIDFSAAGLKAQGFAEFMADITAKTGGSSEAMQALFGSVEATTVALSLSGAAGGFLNDILDDMAEKAGATSAAMALMADDDAQRLNVAMANLNNVMLEFGTGALTALVPAVETAAGAAMLLAENIDVLGIGLGLMASTYIPSAITGLISLSAWLATSEGLFIAGAIASKSMSLAMNAIPFVAVVSGLTLLFRLKGAFTDAADGAVVLKGAYGDLMDAQSRLDAVSVSYFNNVTEGSTRAMQAAAEFAKSQAEIALETATQLLAQQERIDNLLGLGLLGAESPKTKAAREAVETLNLSLLDAETRLSAADAAVVRMQNSLLEAGGAAGAVVTEADKLLESLNSQVAIQQAIVRYGEDSAQVAALQAAADRAAFEEKLKSVDASAAMKDELRAAFAALQSATSAAAAASANIGGAAGEAARLAQNLTAAANALSAVMSATANMNVSAIGLEAQNKALAAGNTLIQARADGLIAAKRAELGDAFGSGDAIIRAAATTELEKYTAAVERNSSAQAVNEGLVKAASDALGGSGGKGGAAKAAKAAAKEASALADEIERLEFDADPVKKYASELADLDKIMATGGLSDGAYAKAVQELNNNLAGSIPMVDGLASAFGEFIGSGLRNFKEFGQSIIDTFKNMIVTMVTTAARNRILFSMGITGGGIGGAAQAAVAPGGGGILSGLLGGGGGGGGGLLGGISGALGTIGANFGAGFMSSVYGGLGGLTGAVSGGLSVGGLAGISTAIGAVAAPLLAVAAVFSFFKKKTKELDAGLRITTTGMDSLIQSFQTIETKRFWGLSKKVRTSFTDLDEATAGPLERIITDLQMGVVGATKALGIGASVFNDFTSSITVSTKGMSDADAQKAVEEALQGFGDDFAGMVPGLEALQQEGEGAYDALTRLSTSLGAANTVLDTLGAALYEISLSGAAAASSLVQAFGGLDQFNAATTAYYAGFYTEQERFDTATRQLTEALGDLGQKLPETRAQFRAIVEAQDLSTESGRKMFASLVSLAGQLDLVLPAVDSLADKLGALTSAAVDAALGPINDQIEASNAAATQARQSADEFFRLADSLRTAAGGIGGIRTVADLANAGRDFASQFAKAISGDVAALGGLGAAGTSLAQNGTRLATTQEDARFLEAQIATQLNQAASVAEALGLGADYQAMLFDVQTAALEVIREGLAQGNITQEILRDQIAMLESIGQQISDSADLQVAVGRDGTGQTVAALLDNAGNIVGSLSAEGARAIAGLQAQTAGINAVTAATSLGLSERISSALDANGDGLISAQEAQAASIVSAYQSTVVALASAIDRNGAMTTAQIRTSLAGKASDAAINSVISAVDRNRDGVVTAEEIAAARTLSGLSSNTAAQLQALTQQSLVFGNAITGQTGSITGTQGLTNDELGKVQDLQGQTVSITELVKRAVAGSETLNEALLNRLSDGITVAGVPSMVSGLNNISNLIARIVSAQEAALAAAEAEANRQQALAKAQAQLESTFTAQQAAIGEVSSASSAIFGLASQFGVYLNAKSGAVDLSQSAKFGVSDQGLFEAQYGQISSTGGSNVSGFKNTFYQDGGLYSQTYGRAGELRNLAADVAARRQAIIDLGGIPSYSVGTDFHPGGLAYVHKDEMINLPRGSSVSTTSQTSKMLDNSAVVEELRALREEVARLRSENNQGHQNTGSEVARGTKPLREVTATGSLPVRVIS